MTTARPKRNDTLLIALDPQDPVSVKSARTNLAQFLLEAGPDACAVSFVDYPNEIFDGIGQPAHWRAVFPNEEDWRLWSDAYKRLDALLPTLPKRLVDVVSTFYHESAQDLFRSLVLLECERQFNRPLVFIIPSDHITAVAEFFRQRDGGPLSVSRLLFLGAGGAISYLSHRLTEITRSVYGKVLGVGRSFRFLPRIRFSRSTGGYQIVIVIPGIAELVDALNSIVSFLSRARQGIGCEIVRIARSSKRLLVGLGQSMKQILGRRSSRRDQRPTAILMTVDDSGSGVNLNPALRIAAELKARRENVIALSTYDSVIKRLHAIGIEGLTTAAFKPNFLSTAGFALCKLWLTLCVKMHPRTSPERFFLLWLYFRLFTWLQAIEAAHLALRKIETGIQIVSVLTVYESLPISVTAGRWATKKGIPWVGFFPILIGERPDANHFPAPLHLVYGDQLQDKMLLHGCDPESILVVGTPTFDISPRDLRADRDSVTNLFPHASGKKLVVVATEAFGLPLIELDPILRALAMMEDVAVVLKVHPWDSLMFFEKFVSSLGNPQNVVVVQKCDLDGLLHAANLLIAILSNIIITAASLGTPTLVCDFSGKSKVLDFVAEGLCSGCYAPGEFSNIVRSLLFDSQSRAEALRRLKVGLRRFNGPNDGKSHQRIASLMQSISKNQDLRGRDLRRWPKQSDTRIMADFATSQWSGDAIAESTRRG